MPRPDKPPGASRAALTFRAMGAIILDKMGIAGKSFFLTALIKG
jgi:hypothetical protein